MSINIYIYIYICIYLRNRAHFLPPRPVDSTAYPAPPSWVSMAKVNRMHRSLHRPPRLLSALFTHRRGNISLIRNNPPP